jgi:hypothetical protein
LRDPRSGDYFTPESAWIFIAEQIAQGVEIYEMVLDNPEGKKAYYFTVPGCPPSISIYVKLQLLSEDVLCRSFHESQPKPDPVETRE